VLVSLCLIEVNQKDPIKENHVEEDCVEETSWRLIDLTKSKSYIGL
jgi:hypothetical protein